MNHEPGRQHAEQDSIFNLLSRRSNGPFTSEKVLQLNWAKVNAPH
jgi:hypothetical protein